MLFKRSEGARRARRAGSRKFQPAVDGVPRLEPRALLHAGPAVAHAAPLVQASVPMSAGTTAALEHALAVSATESAGSVQSIKTPDAIILIPSGLVPGHKYPVVVAFAYNSNPNIPFEVWRKLAEEHDWIVYGSRDFSNAVLESGLRSSDAVAARVKQQLDALPSVLPVDPSRIIFTGMSGGANYADFMNLRYPGYAAGIMINSGRIPSQLFTAHPRPGFLTYPTAADFAGSRRLAVFLCSPSDSGFYGVSHTNDRFMQRLGWDTLFVNFPGGHWNAPVAFYNKAIAWMTSQPSWTANPS